MKLAGTLRGAGWVGGGATPYSSATTRLGSQVSQEAGGHVTFEACPRRRRHILSDGDPRPHDPYAATSSRLLFPPVASIVSAPSIFGVELHVAPLIVRLPRAGYHRSEGGVEVRSCVVE